MGRFQRLIVCALLLSCAGANENGTALPEPFKFATAMRDCAPWDGAAVAVVLATAPADSSGAINPPFLRLAIWKGLDSVQHASFAWPSEDQVGAASYCATEETCEAASSGRVEFKGLGADSTISGQFFLTFPSKGKVSGGFKAKWVSHHFLCG